MMNGQENQRKTDTSKTWFFTLSLSLLTKTNEIEKLIKDLINRYQVEHSLKNLWSIWWPNLKWQT